MIIDVCAHVGPFPRRPAGLDAGPLARLLAPAPRVRGLAVAAGVATLVFVLTSPYLFLHPQAARQLVGVQLGEAYSEPRAGTHYLEFMGYYTGKVAESFGPIGAALVLGGIVIATVFNGLALMGISAAGVDAVHLLARRRVADR